MSHISFLLLLSNVILPHMWQDIGENGHADPYILSMHHSRNIFTIFALYLTRIVNSSSNSLITYTSEHFNKNMHCLKKNKMIIQDEMNKILEIMLTYQYLGLSSPIFLNVIIPFMANTQRKN